MASADGPGQDEHAGGHRQQAEQQGAEERSSPAHRKGAVEGRGAGEDQHPADEQGGDEGGDHREDQGRDPDQQHGAPHPHHVVGLLAHPGAEHVLDE